MQKLDFCAVIGCGLELLKEPLLLGGRKFEESKGYKIVNTYGYYIRLMSRKSIVVTT